MSAKRPPRSRNPPKTTALITHLRFSCEEAEVSLDRGERDVDDRDVQDDHELNAGEQGQCQPLVLGPFDHQTVLSMAVMYLEDECSR